MQEELNLNVHDDLIYSKLVKDMLHFKSKINSSKTFVNYPTLNK